LDPEFLRLEVVELLHDESLKQFGGSPGIKDTGLLISALQRAVDRSYYGANHVDLYDLAAAYAFGISRNHAFHDGNKRTAWASCIAFLQLNCVTFHAPSSEREDMIVALAAGSLSEVDFASWLRQYGCYEDF
jgi:death-on-curing protein